MAARLMGGLDRRVLDERLDLLLSSHPPHACEPAEFWGAQYDLGLAWVDFPEGLGGLDLPASLQEVVSERLRDARAPDNTHRNFVGIGMAAPTLRVYASTSDCARLLRPLFTCDEVWCQLFSEPGAGSDLASLATRAEREGAAWVVNGQKVWTTLAHVARWGLLLARTDPEQPKHLGLTYFVVDMRAPGVEVRPLRQLTGMADFNEVYLTDVRVPDTQRLGRVGEGWQVAMTTLMNERSAIGAVGNGPRGGGPIRRAATLLRAHAPGDPVLRDRFARLWIEAEVVRITALRASAMRVQGTPGPEASVLKLLVSQVQQRVHEFCVDVLGPRGMLVSGYDASQPTTILESTSDIEQVDPVLAFLRTRGMTIAGGTSEIGRTVLGERVLGLPPEPRVDKHLPWSQVPRN